MQGGFGEKDVPNQLFGNLAVNEGAGFEILVQTARPFKNHQRAHLLPGHRLTRRHRLDDDIVNLLVALLGAERFFQAGASHLFHRPAQLRLEQDHQGDQPQLQNPCQQEIQHMQLQKLRGPGQQQEKYHSLGNPRRAGGPYQLDALIDQKRHQ